MSISAEISEAPENFQLRSSQGTVSRMENSLQFLGLTLAGYAAARETSPARAREPYSRMMRSGEGIDLPTPTRVLEDSGVVKFCLPASGYETESVVIPMEGHRGNRWNTLCVSSQIGCRMGCTFCETGRLGLLADLPAEHIVAQLLAARAFASDIRNIVFMGMGEPLDNFDAVARSIRVFTEPAGLDIPMSRITVSTVGRVDGIRRLAALGWTSLRLAVSLNAPHDALRDEIMPINRSAPLADLRRALLDYPLPAGRRFLIEYVVMKNVNDSLGDADAVADWCAPLRCTVNLIPYNPQRDAAFETPDDETMKRFLDRLKERGRFAKWRVTKGRSQMSACGQLGNPEPARR